MLKHFLLLSGKSLFIGFFDGVSTIFLNTKNKDFKSRNKPGASLVVQGLRLHTPSAGGWVLALVGD